MKKLTYIFLFLLSCKLTAQSKITWNSGIDISNNSFSNMHPRIAMDAKGNPLVIWGKMSNESVYFSRWNGTMFTTPVKLNPSWLSIATASWMGPDIAVHGDTIYVVVKRTPESSDTNHIYIISSFNGGITFNAPSRVDLIGDSLSRFPTITTDASGNPIVAFMKFNSLFASSRWVVTKSSDFGSTFSKDAKASGWGNSDEVCDCCPGALLSEGNTSVMLYRNNKVNMRDNWMGISSNNATSFTKGQNIDNNNWMINYCPSSGPDGVIIGDTVYSVFMNGAKVNLRNYLSKSSINGSGVISVSNLTGNIAGLSQQNFPRIASNGNAVAIVWKQSVNSSAQLPILFTNDIRKGFPAMYDTVDLADITNADVAVANGKVFVIWQDDNSGTVKYRSGTFSTTTDIKKIRNNQINIKAFPNPSDDIWHLEGSAISKIITVEVTDISGKQIFLGNPIQNGNLFSFQIDNSSLEIGIYFLKIQTEDTLQTIQLIKK